MSTDAVLLGVYFGLAIGASFLCSLCEAALLSVPASDLEVLARGGNRSAGRLKKMKEHIDRPLAAILTLNTVANTVGATGVGAQAGVVFGSAWVGVTAAALTLVILIFGEVVPKTIGAVHSRRLAGMVSVLVRGMVWLTYPVVVVLNWLVRAIKGSGIEGVMTREQIELMAELARSGGALSASESAILDNLLRLRGLRVEDVMTPRTRAFMLPKDASVRAVLADNPELSFSRIPIYGKGTDDIAGVVLKSDLYETALRGHGDAALAELARPLHPVPEGASLLAVMDEFSRVGHHLFLVVDEYGGTAGVISVEDLARAVLSDLQPKDAEPAGRRGRRSAERRSVS